MVFKRPFIAELTEDWKIWVIDSTGSLVTEFPVTEAGVEQSLQRAAAVAAADIYQDEPAFAGF